jgi:hypothetical protein
MFELGYTIIIFIFAVGIFPFLWLVNYIYQKRADEFADNLLKHIPEEYNKQIKANAYRFLISRSIFGLIFACIGIYNVFAQTKSIYWFAVLYLIFAIGFFAWAIYGYKSELKKIKELK